MRCNILIMCNLKIITYNNSSIMIKQLCRILITPITREKKLERLIRIVVLNHENAKWKRKTRKKRLTQGIAMCIGFFRGIQKNPWYPWFENFVEFESFRGFVIQKRSKKWSFYASLERFFQLLRIYPSRRRENIGCVTWVSNSVESQIRRMAFFFLRLF